MMNNIIFFYQTHLNRDLRGSDTTFLGDFLVFLLGDALLGEALFGDFLGDFLLFLPPSTAVTVVVIFLGDAVIFLGDLLVFLFGDAFLAGDFLAGDFLGDFLLFFPPSTLSSENALDFCY